MRFTLHYDDGDGPGRHGWWRYVIITGVLIVLVGLVALLVIAVRVL